MSRLVMEKNGNSVIEFQSNLIQFDCHLPGGETRIIHFHYDENKYKSNDGHCLICGIKYGGDLEGYCFNCFLETLAKDDADKVRAEILIAKLKGEI